MTTPPAIPVGRSAAPASKRPCSAWAARACCAPRPRCRGGPRHPAGPGPGRQLLRHGPRLRRQPRLLRPGSRTWATPPRNLPGLQDARPHPRRFALPAGRQPEPAADRLSRSLATARSAHAGRSAAHLRQGGRWKRCSRRREENGFAFGITGHHDPAILLEAMRRFDFDTVLVALNAADVHRLPFVKTVLPEAARRGMGVIGMKVCAAGRLVGPGALTIDQAHGLRPVAAGRHQRDHRLLDAGRGGRKRPRRPAIHGHERHGSRQLETATQTHANPLTYYKKPG